MNEEINRILRNMPQVSELLDSGGIQEFRGLVSSRRITEIIRVSAEKTRARVLAGEISGGREALAERIVRGAVKLLRAEIRERGVRVINGTGVVIHTNLGRAPLSDKALAKAAELSGGYSNLEYGCYEGKRRSRLCHVEKLLTDLTGAEDALVVNNNAAAVFLALGTLCRGKNVILSRGEIVEIGDSFRISEIIRESGANIVEVGATNKTYLSDFENAINGVENVGMLLKMHTSNYKVVGFAENVPAGELALLGKKHDIPVMEDMGSGILFDLREIGLRHERTVREAVAEGVDILTFSGDKMLGGPQAGLICGKTEHIGKMRKSQLMRCLRIDKTRLAALEATLTHYLSKESVLDIPIYKMLAQSVSETLERVERLKNVLSNPKLNIAVKPHNAQFGGGSLPFDDVESSAVYVTSEFMTAATIDCFLRRSPVPVIGTVQNGEYILDVRTLADEDFAYLGKIFSEMVE